MNRGHGLNLQALLVALTLVTGCARQSGVLATNQAPDPAPQLPFHVATESNGLFPTGGFASTAIPVGTAVTIRLGAALSSADAHSGDSFAAALDDPIVVKGRMLAPRGAAVTGRVVEARASEGSSWAGYLRLTLSSMDINGHTLILHTSSIFAKGGLSEKPRVLAAIAGGYGTPTPEARLVKDHEYLTTVGKSKDVSFSTERRLTFRLVEAVPPRS